MGKRKFLNEAVEDRARAIKFKTPDTKRNQCNKCALMMCFFDLHPLCVKCRGSDCDGIDKKCAICDGWHGYQKRAYQWAERHRAQNARGKLNAAQRKAQGLPSRNKSATQSGRKNPEPRIKPISSHRMSSLPSMGPVTDAVTALDTDSQVQIVGTVVMDEPLSEGELSSPTQTATSVKETDESPSISQDRKLPPGVTIDQLLDLHKQHVKEQELLKKIQRDEDAVIMSIPDKLPPDFMDDDGQVYKEAPPKVSTPVKRVAPVAAKQELDKPGAPFKAPTKVAARPKPKPLQEQSSPPAEDPEEQDYEYSDQDEEDTEESCRQIDQWELEEERYHRRRYRSRSFSPRRRYSRRDRRWRQDYDEAESSDDYSDYYDRDYRPRRSRQRRRSRSRHERRSNSQTEARLNLIASQVSEVFNMLAATAGKSSTPKPLRDSSRSSTPRDLSPVKKDDPIPPSEESRLAKHDASTALAQEVSSQGRRSSSLSETQRSGLQSPCPSPARSDQPPIIQRRLHTNRLSTEDDPTSPPDTVASHFSRIVNYKGLNTYMRAMFQEEHDWPIAKVVNKHTKVRAMASEIVHPPLPQLDKNPGEMDAYPPSPLVINSLRKATYHLQGRDKDGEFGPEGCEASQYIPDEFSLASQPLIDDFTARRHDVGLRFEHVKVSRLHKQGHLPQKILTPTQLPTPSPSICGTASDFPFYDEKEFLHLSGSESQEADQLRAMGLLSKTNTTLDHYKDAATLKVTTIKAIEKVLQWNLISASRQDWLQMAQIKIVQQMQSRLENLSDKLPSAQRQDINPELDGLANDFGLMSAMLGDASRDLERGVPMNVDSLATLNVVRRDLLIDKLRHGEFFNSGNFNHDNLAWASHNDFLKLRASPLFGKTLFAESHVEEFENRVLATRKDNFKADNVRAPGFLARPRVDPGTQKQKREEKGMWTPTPSWWPAPRKESYDQRAPQAQSRPPAQDKRQAGGGARGGQHSNRRGGYSSSNRNATKRSGDPSYDSNYSKSAKYHDWDTPHDNRKASSGYNRVREDSQEDYRQYDAPAPRGKGKGPRGQKSRGPQKPFPSGYRRGGGGGGYRK